MVGIKKNNAVTIASFIYKVVKQ